MLRTVDVALVGPLGLSVFLGRGMSGWMRVHEVPSPASVQRQEPRSVEVTLPPGLHGDVAVVFAEMVLSSQEAS